MNTAEIELALTSASETKKHFGGVFPSDKLPKLIQKKKCFVANTDPAHKPGKHWVAFFFKENGDGEYFDSFGRPPKKKCFIDFIQRNCRRWKYNKKVLQSPYTTACGQHVIYYLLQRSLGRSMSSILKKFTNDGAANDVKVERYVSKRFDLATPPPTAWLQIATALLLVREVLKRLPAEDSSASLAWTSWESST